ncbi:response regulator transcription factor [Kribbella antibiotica]|uniref:Sensory transduction protein RegX3 n=2 Tax=Kribbella antibiotica TaxID=190195 RepID=A0A4R4ZXT8_9ACTN|nr:response regulator transcription factor [Kribbella antibiotica]TDD63420.1 response regulator transcription factor [Kribbella antibiotica]
MRVLLVEDDPSIAGALCEGLPRYGFSVDHVTTGAAALERFDGSELVLLDLGLPDADGIDICRRIRTTSDVPLIIITARSDEIERVVGLELGADDYVSKPFGLRELVARMRAVTRRGVPRSAESEAVAEPVGQRLGPLRIDRAARRAFVADAEVTLTPKEFDLLSLLAESPGVVLTREQLIASVWDSNWFGSTRTLDVHVGALRKKLVAAVEISTVRGVGFRLEPAGR